MKASWNTGVFNDCITFLSTREAVKKFSADHEDIDWGGEVGEKLEACTGVAFAAGEKGYCIGVFDKSLNTLIHESVHCAYSIVQARNLELGECAETLAYLIESIVAAGRERLKGIK